MPVRSPLRPQHVTPRPLHAITALLGLPMPDSADVQITGVIHDSRHVRPGDLYAALPGANDARRGVRCRSSCRWCGCRFHRPRRCRLYGSLPQSWSRTRGLASASSPPEVYGHPARDLLMLGITGTNGKTTTAYLMESGLRAAGHVTGLIGTVETRVGDERFTECADHAGGDRAARAARASCASAVPRPCVMEVSSHALVLGRVDGIVFDVAAFTNLSEDHLDFHDDLDDYFAAKAALFTVQRSRRGVVMVDDEYGRRLAAQAEIPIVTVSTRHPADWRVVELEAGESRSTAARPRAPIRRPAPGQLADPRRLQRGQCGARIHHARRGGESTDPMRFAASRHVPVFLAAWSGS